METTEEGICSPECKSLSPQWNIWPVQPLWYSPDVALITAPQKLMKKRQTGHRTGFPLKLTCESRCSRHSGSSGIVLLYGQRKWIPCNYFWSPLLSHRQSWLNYFVHLSMSLSNTCVQELIKVFWESVRSVSQRQPGQTEIFKDQQKAFESEDVAQLLQYCG